MAKSILIVDDHSNIREIIRYTLEQAHFVVHEASDGKMALEQYEELKPDLIVLDIAMPELEGTDVCREIRKTSMVPIIFLSSKDDELDRILGLELGGDDYIAKPFSPKELLARIRAIFRRADALQPDSSKNEREVVEHRELRMDFGEYKVYWMGEEVVLTVTEFNILRAMVAYPGKVYSRDELIERAYDDNTVVSHRTIDSHVRRIRDKLNDNLLETVHGVGYRIKK